jgi:hypothetical protein
MKFKSFLENENNNIAYRYIHKDGRGLMNNSSLDYGKLEDEEYFDVEDGYLHLRQPSSEIHGRSIIFAFTSEGVEEHKRLIELLIKASKRGVIRQVLDLNKYDIIWKSEDGQLGLLEKK